MTSVHLASTVQKETSKSELFSTCIIMVENLTLTPDNDNYDTSPQVIATILVQRLALVHHMLHW